MAIRTDGPVLDVVAEQVSAAAVLEALAEALAIGFEGTEQVDLTRPITGRMRAPLERILAWVAPDASFAVIQGGASPAGPASASEVRLRVVFFPKGRDPDPGLRPAPPTGPEAGDLRGGPDAPASNAPADPGSGQAPMGRGDPRAVATHGTEAAQGDARPEHSAGVAGQLTRRAMQGNPKGGDSGPMGVSPAAPGQGVTHVVDQQAALAQATAKARRNLEALVEALEQAAPPASE
jgi:hypothetical protein